MSAKIGIVQMTSTADKTSNFKQAEELIIKAHSCGAKMVFLPECFDFIGTSRDETLQSAEPIDGEIVRSYQNLAKTHQLWLSLGGAHRKIMGSQDNRICNTHMVINTEGKLVGVYDKVHLFDVNIKRSGGNDSERMTMSESRVIRPGALLPSVVRNTPVGNLGLAICYDMRFPELSTYLRYSKQADVIAYPSAFSVPTGEAGHWHTLLRARAIENQCYIVAAAQEGIHNSKRKSYGHSLVIDPWGKVVDEQLNPGPGLLVCEVNVGSGDATSSGPMQVRTAIPVECHRRIDLFPSSDGGHRCDIGTEDFHFGPHTIKCEQVFYRSPQSFAFVNISPLVPGHVLVSPVKCIARLCELSPGQLADLYLTARRIAEPISKYFNASSLTISIQDGVDAGQSVPHVHIHVLPRKPNDFARNDDIYQALQAHDKVANRVYRTEEAMADEARVFRTFFYDD